MKDLETYLHRTNKIRFCLAFVVAREAVLCAYLKYETESLLTVGYLPFSVHDYRSYR